MERPRFGEKMKQPLTYNWLWLPAPGCSCWAILQSDAIRATIIFLVSQNIQVGQKPGKKKIWISNICLGIISEDSLEYLLVCFIHFFIQPRNNYDAGTMLGKDDAMLNETAPPLICSQNPTSQHWEAGTRVADLWQLAHTQMAPSICQELLLWLYFQIHLPLCRAM